MGSNPAKSEERWSDSHVATLAVREAWKGSAERAMEVIFNPVVVCPAPPRHVEGRVVVAFLRRVEGAWHTVAMSYGTRSPLDEVEARAYAEVVRAAAQALGPTPAKDATPSREWALEAARHRATRWDGLYRCRPAPTRGAPGTTGAGDPTGRWVSRPWPRRAAAAAGAPRLG